MTTGLESQEHGADDLLPARAEPLRLGDMEGHATLQAQHRQHREVGERLGLGIQRAGFVKPTRRFHPRRCVRRSLRAEHHERTAHTFGNLTCCCHHCRSGRSKRSRFMTLFHAATKSRTNFSLESSLA